MRCSAVVTETRRRHPYHTDPRCQRLAKTRGFCLQHAEERSWDHQCQHRACRSRDVRRQGQTGWWLCDRHTPMYETHQRILERILSIPAR